MQQLHVMSAGRAACGPRVATDLGLESRAALQLGCGLDEVRVASLVNVMLGKSAGKFAGRLIQSEARRSSILVYLAGLGLPHF